MDYLTNLDLFNPEVLRGIASILSILGSVILAIRVKNIIKALSFVAKVHDNNIMQLSDSQHIATILTDSPEHIENAEKSRLLIIGFILLGLAGALNGIAVLFS